MLLFGGKVMLSLFLILQFMLLNRFKKYLRVSLFICSFFLCPITWLTPHPHWQTNGQTKIIKLVLEECRQPIWWQGTGRRLVTQHWADMKWTALFAHVHGQKGQPINAHLSLPKPCCRLHTVSQTIAPSPNVIKQGLMQSTFDMFMYSQCTLASRLRATVVTWADTENKERINMDNQNFNVCQSAVVRTGAFLKQNTLHALFCFYWRTSRFVQP